MTLNQVKIILNKLNDRSSSEITGSSASEGQGIVEIDV